MCINIRAKIAKQVSEYISMYCGKRAKNTESEQRPQNRRVSVCYEINNRAMDNSCISS